MWKNYGISKIEQLLKTATEEVFKIAIGQYNIFELPLNQENIRNICYNELCGKMVNYPVKIIDVRIINYDWSDEFDKQIAATMQKAQEVKQKEQELKITEFEAQKRVKDAEANKQALITIAEGEKESVRLTSEAKVLQGEAIRKYNSAIAQNIDIELKLKALEIEKIKAEKWNGQYVPTNNYAPIPFMQGQIQGK
jgi:regulator of protease activity HflC (stomatin/prohibitin superfamily)